MEDEYTGREFAKDVGKAMLQGLLAQILAMVALLGLGFAYGKYIERKEKNKK